MSDSTNNPLSANQPAAKKASKSNVPKAAADFANTVTDVDKAWEENPQITLVWITQAEFKTKATAYNAALDERNKSGSKRPAITSELKQLDNQLDEGVEYLKRYLAADFGSNASAQYAKFGIKKQRKNYRLPADRDDRKNALKLMLPAIEEHSYNDKPFGKDYFTPLIASFNASFGTAKDTDKTTSEFVSDKNVLKKELSLVLQSLIYVLRGNYPNTYKAELRKWGFQKEKY